MLLDDPPLALTFDDVLLVPRESSVLPADVSVATQLAPGLRLNVPLLAAAMDTVSEADMGIAMAQQGGLAILHKNMSAAQQAGEVRKVKRAVTGVIDDPVTIPPNTTLGQARATMRRHDISGLPVVDGDRIVGRLRRQDMLRCIQAHLTAEANRYQEKVNRERAAQRPKSIQAMQETAAASSRKDLARRFTRNR